MTVLICFLKRCGGRSKELEGGKRVNGSSERGRGGQLSSSLTRPAAGLGLATRHAVTHAFLAVKG